MSTELDLFKQQLRDSLSLLDDDEFPMPVFKCECCRVKDAVLTLTVAPEHVDLCNGCAKLVWERCMKDYHCNPEQRELQSGQHFGVN